MEIKSGGITSSLIVKFSGEKDLKKITRLDFYSKSLKIKRIENLEECENLQELRLTYNYISKIENLSSLSNLKLLDLSENSIKKIENLDSLVKLEHLNLSGNLLKEINREGLQGLKNLIFFNVSKNKIARISEFGNLDVLNALEHVLTAGNMVKQADLKDYLPAKISSLKMIDGEPVSHNPSVNASLWVYKENLKDLKNELGIKSKEVNSLIDELNVVHAQIQEIEKSTPDKKYMKELLDRAETLNNTSLSLQQSMCENREHLSTLSQRLDSLRSQSKDSGNQIIEEIHLLDERKLLKETIEEQESQYAVVIEELEKIASEITRMDSLINSTPKFKSSEVKSLEIKSKDLNDKILNFQAEIANLKKKIEECNELIGNRLEINPIDSALEKIWTKLTDQLWIEESEDQRIEYKRWANKICQIIDKERSEFLAINSKQNEEIKKLEAKIQIFSKKLQEKNNFEVSGQVEELKREIDNLREIIVKKNKEIKNLQEKNQNLQEVQTNLQEKVRNLQEKIQNFSEKNNGLQNFIWKSEENPEFQKNFQIFLSKMKINNPESFFTLFEKYKNLFDHFEEKCSRFKQKKQKLLASYSAKNQEISEKIQKLNQDRADLQKFRQSLQKDPQKVHQDSLKETLSILSEEIHSKRLELNDLESKLEVLQNEKHVLESSIIKLDYKLQSVKEECEVYNEKKFKTFQDLSRMQALIDDEGEKLQETRIKVKESSESLQNHQKVLQDVEKNKDFTCSEQVRIAEDIKCKENQLYYLEHKIQEAQVQLRVELENVLKVSKSRQAEIKQLELDIEAKQNALNIVSLRLTESSHALQDLNEKSKIAFEMFEENRIKSRDCGSRAFEIEKASMQFVESVKLNEERLFLIENEIRNKQENLCIIKKQIEEERLKLQDLESRNSNLDQALRQTNIFLDKKEEELQRVSHVLNSKYQELNELKRHEKSFNFFQDSRLRRPYCETDRVFSLQKDLQTNQNISRSKNFQEISRLSTNSGLKDSEYPENRRIYQQLSDLYKEL